METARTERTLALVTALLLVLGVLALFGAADGQSVFRIGDLPVADGAGFVDLDGDGQPDAVDLDGDGVPDVGGNDPTDGPTGDGAQDATETPTDDASDAADPDDPTVGATEAPVSALTAPAAGTYIYDASGNWGLSSDAMYTLPETAQAVVDVTDTSWSWELTAGDRFTDTLTFLETDEGLEWAGWSIYRRFSTDSSTTPYVCEADGAYHVPGNAEGRTAGHDCQASGGAITTDGWLETQAATTLKLGDGTAVEAVHLVYESTDGGDGVSGGSRMELWLDPATGLRLKETRSVDSRQVVQGVEYVYTEDVSFLLRSLDPA